jgi:tubulin-specific chaperone E
MATVRLGQRVADKDGARGTVRYIGPVITSKTADAVYAGTWTCVLPALRFSRCRLPGPVPAVDLATTGIEWDDPSRGKHDGSVVAPDGSHVRYFTCGPTSGSFLKVNLLDVGVPFLAALVAKYEDTTAAGGTVTTEGGQALEIELVGDEKIRYASLCGRFKNAPCLSRALWPLAVLL